MPLNFSSAADLPPLQPECIASSSSKLNEDADEANKSGKSNTWYSQFMQSCNNPINDDKIHLLMLDFLITEGFQEIAISFANEAGIEFKPEDVRDVCHLSERDAIRSAVLSGKLDLAIELINKLCPNLLEKNSLLYFQILRQQLVELIRNKEVVQALQFAQDHLVDKCEQNKDELDKLEQTFALLAFDKPEESPFGKLMHPSQRLTLSSAINEAIFKEMGAQPSSRLQKLMSIMVWNRYQTLMQSNVNTPVNKQIISKIARNLFAEPDVDEKLLVKES